MVMFREINEPCLEIVTHIFTHFFIFKFVFLKPQEVSSVLFAHVDEKVMRSTRDVCKIKRSKLQAIAVGWRRRRRRRDIDIVTTFHIGFTHRADSSFTC